MPVAGSDQRVQRDYGAVVAEVEPIEPAGDLLELLDLLAFEPEAIGERAAMRALKSRRGMNLDPNDPLGGLRRDLLDVHAARRGGDEGDASRVAVQKQAEIELA